MRKVVLLALISLLFALRAAAASDPQQVFLVGGNQLTFIDLMTGDSHAIPVTGDHFTATRSAILFYDLISGRVMVANADGTLTQHPFMQPSAGASRIDWNISHDEGTIAWTETRGDPSALTTTTWIAGMDGSGARQVFSDGPRNGIRAYPVAFSEDNSVLYMDYQPNTIGDLTPFRQYAGLFALNLADGTTNSLPGEPGCFCGAGIDSDFFLRLTLADGGFGLRIRRLSNNTETTLPPLNNFTQAGDVLIAPDGKRAVYALAQISGFGTAAQSLQTVIVLVDLLNFTQQPLGAPANRLLRPILWTEDDSGALFADPQSQTTWKATLSDGAFEQVANGVYLGTLIPN
jgi:hypothetical protein